MCLQLTLSVNAKISKESHLSVNKLFRLLRNRKCQSGPRKKVVANISVRSTHNIFHGYRLERDPSCYADCETAAH
jgi:hypothetical protein